MSSTVRAPRRGMGAVKAGVLALALAAVAAALLAPAAGAAFTSGKCAGADIIGRGASFARDAHNNVFIPNFKPTYCKGTPKLASVTYEALGSGEGRKAVKARNLSPRFGMSDEPPTVAEVADMNAGGTVAGSVFTKDSDPSNDGQVHVIPAAVGAVAALVNFPNGCDVTDLDVASRTPEENLDADATPDDVVRVRFTKAEFEAIWSQGSSGDPLLSWEDMFEELDDTPACEMPIIRVVRFDDSGTSYAFKDYLNSIDSGEGWLSSFATGGKTQLWPGAELGEGGQCPGKSAPGKQADELDHLTSGCANGNGELVKKLVEVDGSVGYSDISTARNNSTGSLAVAPETNDNDTYWTQIQNGSNTFVEPTADPKGFRTDGAKGANCEETEFENVPSTTFGNWENASGVKSPVGYGICTMTYGLVFDDNSDVWGGSPAEEAKARTVKDYWESVVSDTAQAGLFGNDYARLPEDILTIARAGVAAVNWEGAASSGGGGGGGAGGGGSTGGGGAVVQPLAPSNLFSLPKKSISSKTGQATVSVKIPGPGKVELVGTASVPSGKASRVYMKTITVGKVTLTASKAGTYNLTLKPNGAAKKQLRKKGKLRVNLKVTFTPTGGAAKTSTSSVTLKLAKKKAKKGK